ncbi:hypothetical protein MKX01_001594 [Papaver californicum]|nr:hypothetical protein MKX01_001594 [Papaver californicum]
MAAAKFSIKTTSSFFLVMCLTVFTLSCYADPDPLQDFCVADLNTTTTIVNGFPCKPVSQVTSNDFFFSGLVNEASTDNPFGLGVRFGDVENFPGLNTLGLSINRANFAPGGIIPIHTHPRANEANFVIKGKVRFGFITTTNVLYSKLQDFCVADLNATKIIMNGFPCKPLSEVTNDGSFYSGLMNEASTDNPFGVGIRPGDVTSFPALNTLGLNLDLAPGGSVPVHTHPRGSEACLVIKGKSFLELSVIPKGLVHFVQNVGPGKAVVLAIFNSQSPGSSVIPFNLFASTPAIPNDILAKNFLVDEKVIDGIKSKFGN